MKFTEIKSEATSSKWTESLERKGLPAQASQRRLGRERSCIGGRVRRLQETRTSSREEHFRIEEGNWGVGRGEEGKGREGKGKEELEIA